jgi:hypothetical protein
MNKVEKFQQVLDKVTANGGRLTYGYDVSLVSKAFALVEMGEGVIVRILSADSSREWTHLVADFKRVGEGIVLVLATPTKPAILYPLGDFASDEVKKEIAEDSRTREEALTDFEEYLEANPTMNDPGSW